MSDSGITTRAPVIVFVALTLAAFGLPVVMWASVCGGYPLLHTLGSTVYFLALHVYLSYQVHKDATLKGRNATSWAVIAFLLLLVGAALYSAVTAVGRDVTN